MTATMVQNSFHELIIQIIFMLILIDGANISMKNIMLINHYVII